MDEPKPIRVSMLDLAQQVKYIGVTVSFMASAMREYAPAAHQQLREHVLQVLSAAVPNDPPRAAARELLELLLASVDAKLEDVGA